MKIESIISTIQRMGSRARVLEDQDAAINRQIEDKDFEQTVIVIEYDKKLDGSFTVSYVNGKKNSPSEMTSRTYDRSTILENIPELYEIESKINLFIYCDDKTREILHKNYDFNGCSHGHEFRNTIEKMMSGMNVPHHPLPKAFFIYKIVRLIKTRNIND